MNRSELVIVVMMRTMGIGGLLAIPAIFFPYSWMNACHEFMGLGTMPDAPIVGYLARSLSAFYAVVGAITLYVTCDIRRNRSLVKLWAIIVAILGVTLLFIDLAAGMPMSWTCGEGPPAFVIGLVLFWLQSSIKTNSTELQQDGPGE